MGRYHYLCVEPSLYMAKSESALAGKLCLVYPGDPLEPHPIKLVPHRSLLQQIAACTAVFLGQLSGVYWLQAGGGWPWCTLSLL